MKNYDEREPIWFTEDGYPAWRPGYIASNDKHPESFWKINHENNRQIRRDIRDIKPRLPSLENRNPVKTPY